MKKTWLRALLVLSFVLMGFLATSAFFACNSTEPGQPTFNIKGDSAWLKFDKILILRADSLGNVKDTLFAGKLKSFDQLIGLPAGDFNGGKAQILVKGFKDEEEILTVTSNYNGATQKAETQVDKDLLANPDSLKLSADTLRITVDQEKEITVQIFPTKAAQVFTLSKDGGAFDYSVLVLATGTKINVLGKQKGEGMLLVRAIMDSTRVDTLFVVVDFAPVASVTLNADTLRLKAGGYRDSLLAVVKPNTANPRVVFTSSDSEVVTVDSMGRVLSGSVGGVWIYAVSGNRRDSTWIEVVANQAPKVAGLKDTTVSINDTLHLYFKAKDADGQLVTVGVDIKRNGKLDDTLPLLSDTTKLYHLRRIFTDSGTYSVYVGALDNDGAITMDSAKIHVLQDVPVVDAGRDTSGKAGKAITLQGNATQKFGRIVMWKWDFNGDGIWDDSSALASAMSYTYGKDGNYNAKLYARDDDGNEASDVRVVSMGNDLPQFASKHGDTTVSLNDSVAFSASLLDQDGLITQVAWDFDGNGISDDSTTFNSALVNVKASHRYASAGKYTVLIRGRDNGGGSIVDSLHVTVVLDAPVANAGGDTTVLTATSIALHANGTDAYGVIRKREWKIGTSADFITVGSIDTVITSPIGPAPLVCILRVTDDDGLTGLDTLLVNVIYDTDSRLSALAGSSGTMTPVFASETLAYTLTIANTANSVRILPTVRSGRATVKVNGTALTGTPAGVTLATPTAGNYTATVVVTAEDTSKHTSYAVTVTKVPSAISTLSALSAAYFTLTDTTTVPLALTPTFTPATLNYTLTVPDTVDSVTITAAKTNTEAVVRVNGNTSTSASWRVKADTGLSSVAVQVTAGDASVRNYSLKVYRKAWIQVGATPFINGTTAYLGLTVYKGIPVVGYRTGTGFISVSQLSGNNWVDAGNNPISPGNGYYAKFAASPNYVFSAFGDYSTTASGNGKVGLRRWSGVAGTWTSRLISDSSLYSGSISLATFNDSAYIGYSDQNPINFRRLQIKKYSASGVLTSLGTVSDSTLAGEAAIATDSVGKVWVAYSDLYANRDGRITLKYWNPATLTWVYSASLISAGTASYLNFKIKGDTMYLAFRDVANQNKLTVLRKIGTAAWSNLGGSGFSDGIASYVSMAIYGNEPYVAYSDASFGSKAVVKVYRGAGWQTIGTAGFSPGVASYLSLDFDTTGRPNLAYAVNSTGVLVRYYDPQAEGE